MKKIILDFMHHGLHSFGFGPMVLAVVYLFLQKNNILQSLTINEVCLGIFSSAALAFIVGGANIIYQIERLALLPAILIHGGILYISYIIVYLLNGWLKGGFTPVLVFTGIFIVGYLVIMAIIITTTKKSTARLNDILKQKQKNAEDN